MSYPPLYSGVMKFKNFGLFEPRLAVLALMPGFEPRIKNSKLKIRDSLADPSAKSATSAVGILRLRSELIRHLISFAKRSAITGQQNRGSVGTHSKLPFRSHCS